MKFPRTLFDDQIDDQFLKLLGSTGTSELNLGPKTLEGTFIIHSPHTPVKYPSYFFEMHSHVLVCRKDCSKEPIASMDVLNSLMRRGNETVIEGKPHFSIRFIKKGAYEELLSPDENQIDLWFESLKRYCLLTRFRNFFDSKRVIGKGTFAKVFLVERKTSGEEFAVKAFSKAAVFNDSIETKSLQNEINIMRVVNHERLISLKEVYEGENYIYCILELFKGQDLLKTIIAKGAQPEPKALAITLQILQGLEYLHSKKILHRDIKPENIVFKTEGEDIDLGIVDLGFATFEGDYRNLFTRCGTPGYVAPEVLNDQEYNCKADIFSLGVILYIILTGNMPFQGNTYEEIVKKNKSGIIDFDFCDQNLKLSTESCLISNRPT